VQTTEFSRSFVTFVTPGRGNNARIQVECTCRLSDPGGATTRFILVASCKSENTYAPDDLFMQPNYDFCCIFSDRDYQIIRTFPIAGLGGKETGVSAERFDEIRIHLVAVEREACADNAAIVAATLANRPLVGRTELSDEHTGRRAVLEYPIKTMNVNDLQAIFQVDTGPVLYPDLNVTAQPAINCLDLAYIACNRFDRAEFILQVPTPVPEGGPPALVVPHYSAVRKQPARNTIWALPT